MRLFLGYIILGLSSALALAQGTPPMDSVQLAQSEGPALQADGGTPAVAAHVAYFQQAKDLVKMQIKKAIDGRPYPLIEDWKPLTARQKFDKFLKHTYSPSTFAGAGIDALKGNFRDRNREYERGFRGIGQRAGIELGTGESDVFFQQFLIPTLLKQDPRYFRNPSLPFFRRALYSVSRVVITHADNGHQTFNASRIVGGSISQALSDLYVPGQRQGMSPIYCRVGFNLVRDAGFNLVHEFWPDMRRKFLHR